MRTTHSSHVAPKVGDIDPITGRSVLTRRMMHLEVLTAKHLISKFVPVELSAKSIAWQFNDELPRASNKQRCFEILLINKGHNPYEVVCLYKQWREVTEHHWMALAGVLELFQATTPKSSNAIETLGEADECITKWAHRTSWLFAPSKEILGTDSQLFEDALRSAVKNGLISIGPKRSVAGLHLCAQHDDEVLLVFKQTLSEKCDSNASSAVMNLMRTFGVEEEKRLKQAIHKALRMNTEPKTFEDFLDGFSQAMNDLSHMGFHKHDDRWKAFCCMLNAFSKTDWETVCFAFVAFDKNLAFDVPKGFKLPPLSRAPIARFF